MQYLRLLSSIILFTPFVIGLPATASILQGIGKLENPEAKFARSRRGLVSRSDQNVKDPILLSAKGSMIGIDEMSAQQRTSREMDVMKKRSMAGMNSNGLEINKMNILAEQKRSISVGETNQLQETTTHQMQVVEGQNLLKRSLDSMDPDPRDMVRELNVLSRVEERSLKQMSMKEQQESTPIINERNMLSESYLISHSSSQNEDAFL
ncbi:hypothetical protein DFH28DRAFT_96860 [Melampsora americana]|nr:hypothetical protein DFH28DRAFT_96860 [Melampsora americana]